MNEDTTDGALVDRSFSPLPLGSVKPRGWLRDQLRTQADGLGGHIDERWPDLADNQWLGGSNDGWERGPYYADGLVPLAHLLDDDRLLAKADEWVDAFVDGQDDRGWIGPTDQACDQGYEEDPWPRFVVLKALRQHVEATGDDRALDAMVEFCRYLRGALDERELESWGRYRWADLVVTLDWLYERTGEAWLLDVAETAAEQGYDWRGHFEAFEFTRPQPPEERRKETHVVNNAMGVKAPAVRFRRTGAEGDAAAASAALDALDRYHGQATGVFTGDEHLAGRDPSRGTELCAVVEYMYSLERLVSVLGDAAFADRLERVAYNALPATFSPDMWTHQYDQQANQVLCTVADRGWTNGPEATLFGLAPHFGCCAANMHQGWPKFASSLWMGTPDGGLAAVAYAPCEVTTTVADGTRVTVTETTAYPFDDGVSLTVDPESPAAFPLALRVPGWADGATLTLPDGGEEPLDPGGFRVVAREWTDGDEVTLDLSARVTAERRYEGGVSLARGPLVFALPVAEEWKRIGGTPPTADWEVYPDEPWNYGLSVDTDDPAATAAFGSTGTPSDGTPFAPDAAPVELTVEGRRVPEWTLADNGAGPLPASPTVSAEPPTEFRLVPYGCTNLRVTEFPLLSDPS